MTLVGRQAVSPLLLAIFSGQAAVQTVNGIGTIMCAERANERAAASSPG